jgi:hypothetical protein
MLLYKMQLDVSCNFNYNTDFRIFLKRERERINIHKINAAVKIINKKPFELPVLIKILNTINAVAYIFLKIKRDNKSYLIRAVVT